MSVETSRVRLGLRPGILVPDCSVGLPYPATALHMCFLFFLGFFFFQRSFPESLFGLTSGNYFYLCAREYIPTYRLVCACCSSVLLLFVSLFLKGSVHEMSRS